MPPEVEQALDIDTTLKLPAELTEAVRVAYGSFGESLCDADGTSVTISGIGPPGTMTQVILYKFCWIMMPSLCKRGGTRS